MNRSGPSPAGHARARSWSAERIRNHALLPFAGDLRAADAALAPHITEAALAHIVDQVPDAWLEGEATPIETRRGYIEHLRTRLSAPRAFVEEALRAQLV